MRGQNKKIGVAAAICLSGWVALAQVDCSGKNSSQKEISRVDEKPLTDLKNFVREKINKNLFLSNIKLPKAEKHSQNEKIRLVKEVFAVGFPRSESFMTVLYENKDYELHKIFADDIYNPAREAQISLLIFLKKQGVNSISEYVEKIDKLGNKITENEAAKLKKIYKSFEIASSNFMKFAEENELRFGKEMHEKLTDEIYNELIFANYEEIMRVMSNCKIEGDNYPWNKKED